MIAFVSEQPMERLFLSAVTLAEIRFGIEQVDDATKRAELADWLSHKVRPLFERRVPQVGEDMSSRMATAGGGRPQGPPHVHLQPDLFIAATALVHGLTIVSRDVADYERAKAPVLNPWLPRP